MKKSLTLAGLAIVAALAFNGRALGRALRTWEPPTFILDATQTFTSAATESHTGAETHTGTETHGGAISNTGGALSLSSSTSAGFRVKWLGALAAKPATSTEGDQYYDTVQHTICMATATKSDNSAWLKGNIATTGAAWTLY